LAPTNRRQKQKRTALRNELLGIAKSPFDLSDELNEDEQQEIRLLAALVGRIYLPADKRSGHREADVVLPTAHIMRIAKQWWLQGLRVHPELAKIAVVIEDGNPRIVEVKRD
jgi:hypothetical protein